MGFGAADLRRTDEEEGRRVLSAFISNPNECTRDGTKIYLGKQNHLGSLVRALNGAERGKNALTSDK